MPGFAVIVAGTDGSSLGEEAVAHAARIAAQEGGELHLVTAFPDAGHMREKYNSSARSVDIDLRQVAEDALTRASSHVEAQGGKAVVHLVDNDAADALLDVAQEVGADLIVVGSRGLSKIERFTMGSVSHKVFHHAPCSVMVVKGA